MPSATASIGYAQNLETFLEFIKDAPLETSIELLISLLKRRQIKHSRACAKATGYLLKELVSNYNWTDENDLMDYVQQVGRRLSDAQPREMVVANIVRRVLGLIRDEVAEDRDESSAGYNSTGYNSPGSPMINSPSAFVKSPRLIDSLEGISELRRAQTSRPSVTTSPSMFNLLAAGPDNPWGTPPRSMTGVSAVNSSILAKQLGKEKDNTELKSEITVGIEEILDELSQVEDQIAAYGPNQIVEGEYLLTLSASITVQKFLLKTAHSRKFTVFHAETFPNENEAVYDTLVGQAKSKDDDELLSKEAFLKPLTAVGIDVIFCKDHEILAAMCRVHKVIISPHIVLANGGLVAAAGARIVAKAAKAHRVPVIVLSGVYKLSPEYPFDHESLTEYGDPSKVLSYREGSLVKRVEVANPLLDYVAPDLVNLYITNLGPCAPSYLYRVVADHYKAEDINFNKPELNF